MSPQVVHEPCEWPLDLSCPCDLPEGVDPELIDRMTNVATSTLWRLSGWLYPACEVEARPCARRCLPDLFDFARQPWAPWLIDGRVLNLTTCGCPTRGCSCRQLETVELPGSPITAVTEVWVDGLQLDGDAWRWDPPDEIIRCDGGAWPACTDFCADADEPGSFVVRYLIGHQPDAAANLAHSTLVCHLVHQCVPDLDCECKVDSNAVAEGFTGLALVDQWAALVNPTDAHGGPSVVLPGDRHRARARQLG